MKRYSIIRKAILSILLIFILFMNSDSGFAERPFPKPSGPVNDFANVIPPDYEQKMIAITTALYRKTGTAVVVVTMPDIGGAEYNEYVNRLYSAWGIGKAGEDKGVLIFVTVKERKMRIETGYGVEGILPDGLVGEIRDKYIIPYLRQDKFGYGLLNGTLAVTQVISEHAGVTLTAQEPVRTPKKSRGYGLFLFPLILLFIIFMFASRRRGGMWLFFLPMLLGRGGGYSSGGFGGSFGGFGGGFGGFGGGMSGGGGAGGSF